MGNREWGHCWVLSSLVCLLLAECLIGGGGLETEVGEPVPALAEGEWIFSNTLFGKVQQAQVEFCFRFSNPTGASAYVEWAFYDDSGKVPNIRLINGRKIEARDSYFLLPRSEVDFFCYNSEESPVDVPRPFAGWTEVKSSRPIEVTAFLRIREGGGTNPPAGIELFGQPAPIRRVRFQLRSTRHSSGTGVRGTGLSLVNPREEEIQLLVSLWAAENRSQDLSVAEKVAEQVVVIPARQQRRIFLEDFFPGGEGAYFAEARSMPESSGFGYASLAFSSFSQRLRFIATQAHSTQGSGDLVLSETFDGTWDFPVEIIQSATIGERMVEATRFGFYVREPDGSLTVVKVPQVTSLETADTDGAVIQYPAIVINSPEGKWVLFEESKSVVKSPQVGEVRRLREIGDSAVELASFWRDPLSSFPRGFCRFVLIDVTEYEVSDIFSSESCLETPPWRSP